MGDLQDNTPLREDRLGPGGAFAADGRDDRRFDNREFGNRGTTFGNLSGAEVADNIAHGLNARKLTPHTADVVEFTRQDIEAFPAVHDEDGDNEDDHDADEDVARSPKRDKETALE